MMQSELSLKSFSTAVEAIYDCALDAAHWKEALRLIGALMDSPYAAIGTTDYARGRHENAVFVGVDPNTSTVTRRNSPSIRLSALATCGLSAKSTGSRTSPAMS